MFVRGGSLNLKLVSKTYFQKLFQEVESCSGDPYIERTSPHSDFVQFVVHCSGLLTVVSISASRLHVEGCTR